MTSRPSSDAILQLAKRNVASALKLDGEGKLRDAYIQYLKSVQYIVGDLLYGSTVSDGDDNNDPRLARLAQQCMDRASELCQGGVNRIPHTESDQYQMPSRPGSSNSVPSVQSPGWTSPTSPFSVVSTSTGTDSSLTLRGRSDSLTTPTTRGRSESLTTPTTPHSETPTLASASLRSRDLTPTEIATLQNQKLMTAYRARMTKLGKNEASNLSLSLQRRLAENVAIAQAREKSLAKKVEERNRRLEEQAARRFSSMTGMSQDEQERRQMYTKVLQYEHNTQKWLLAWRKKLEESPENENIQQDLVKQIISNIDHPLTSLLKKYQYAIYDKIQPLLVKFRVEVTDPSPNDMDCKKMELTTDTNHSQAYLNSSVESSTQHEEDEFDYLFECENPSETSNTTPNRDNDHTDSINEHGQPSANKHSSRLNSNDSCEIDVKDKGDGEKDTVLVSGITKLPELEKEALSRHLNNIVQDIHEYLEKIQTMFVVAYDSMDSPEGRDVLHACIEEPFFKPIWGYLIELYRLVNYEKEISLIEVLSKYENSSPCDLKVSEKFCLRIDINNENSPESMLVDVSGDNPYGPAISELQSLGDYGSPLSKLECIVRVSRLMCTCAEEWYNKIHCPVPSIGADDLIPILCYVVVKAQLSQMAAECQALEELMHEGYLMGEEGYCLTSLQTALSYILTL